MRKPLMLSDTAMALLRQYEALDYQYLKNLLNAPELQLTRAYIHEVKTDMLKNASLRTLIQSEFLREMSLLSLFPEIRITRFLDWHLVLDNELTAWMEQNTALLQTDYLAAVSSDTVELNDFFSQVYKSYTTAHDAHAATIR